MRKFSRAVVVLLAASAPACILFGVDDLTGSGSSPDSGTTDGTIDTSTIDGAVTDSTTPIEDAGTDGAVDFCKSIDAALCDTFDRDGAIAVGAPWMRTSAGPGCTLGVSGELTTTFDASASQQNCYLVSNPITTKNGHFTLNFDVTYTTDTSSVALILLAQLAVDFPGAVDPDSGVQVQNFQLFVDGVGSGRVGMYDFFPDATVSAQPGNYYVAYAFGNATPFVHASPPCHITWDIDSITPTATATSNCDGVMNTTVASSGGKPRAGYAGTATLNFGFANPSAIAPAWSITYDNMIFRAAP